MTIVYTFRLPDGSEEEFYLELDKETLELAGSERLDYPQWAELEYHQCSHCPLNATINSYCPLAASLARVVKKFKFIMSYDQLSLDVLTNERLVSHKTTAQRALGSFMGLVMATCGCPYTSYFRPMARFHLPLASEEETIYRSTSMYLLAQYFIKRDEGQADLDFVGLEKIYKNIQTVNSSIVERLRAASKADSSVNAVILLDMYARSMPCVIDESLEELRYLFSAYLA